MTTTKITKKKNKQNNKRIMKEITLHYIFKKYFPSIQFSQNILADINLEN